MSVFISLAAKLFFLHFLVFQMSVSPKRKKPKFLGFLRRKEKSKEKRKVGQFI